MTLDDPAPAKTKQEMDEIEKRERKYLEWANQRLYEEIRAKWAQIERTLTGGHLLALGLAAGVRFDALPPATR